VDRGTAISQQLADNGVVLKLSLLATPSTPKPWTFLLASLEKLAEPVERGTPSFRAVR
jgi:hypothetical protein